VKEKAVAIKLVDNVSIVPR